MINSPQYYELPNGQILKQTKDGVFAYDPARRTWKEDAHHTSVLAWDRPCGNPCAHLRQKVDRLQRENDRLNTYLDGLEAGLRAARSLRREGGEPA